MQFPDTSSFLAHELQWLQKLMQFRCRDTQTDVRLVSDLQPIALQTSESILYSKIINEYKFSFEDRLLTILALAPTIAPQFLDKELFLWGRQAGSQAAQPIWGIIYGNMYKGALPSAQLFLYLLVGDVFEKRLFATRKLLNFAYNCQKKDIVFISDVPVAEPKTAGLLSINDAFLPQLID